MEFKKTQKKITKLETLIELSKIMNSTLDLPEVLDHFRSSAKKILNAEFCTIYLINEDRNELYSVAIDDPRIDSIHLPIGSGVAGCVADTGKAIITNNAYDDDRFDPDVDKKIGGHTKNLCTVAMKNHENKIIGVIQLMNKPDDFTNEDAQYLESLAIHASIALENAKMHEVELTNQRLRKEMELASEVQKMFLPDKFPKNEKLDTSVVYRPYYKVSGDIYDFVYFTKKITGVAVGDVSGKGISAALIMSMIKTLFASLAEGMPSTKDICSILNRSVAKVTKSMRFCTFFYCIIDTDRGKLLYTNAGHNPPVIIHENGDYDLLKGGGALIGALEHQQYEEFEVAFKKGDTLLMYTDGVSESRNKVNEMYTEERLINVAVDKQNDPNKGLSYLIEDHFKDFISNIEQVDDYTIISVKHV